MSVSWCRQWHCLPLESCWIGYVLNVEQTDSTLLWMRIMFFVLPGLLTILGVLVALRFKITPATRGILKSELERLRAGGNKAEADEGTQTTCQLLTGVAYEKLYP